MSPSFSISSQADHHPIKAITEAYISYFRSRSPLVPGTNALKYIIFFSQTVSDDSAYIFFLVVQLTCFWYRFLDAEVVVKSFVEKEAKVFLTLVVV